MALRRMDSDVYVFDNDTLTLAFHGNENITRRVLDTPSTDIWLPAPVVEEQLRGRLSLLSSFNPSRPSDSSKTPLAYDLLLETLHFLHGFQYLPYTPEAESLFQSWPAAVKRVGTRNCRIAATALTHGFVVVTCNTRHFQPIPGVRLENWSQ